MTIDEKRNPANRKSSFFNAAKMAEMMNELELNVTKLMELKEESGSVLVELRNHLIEIYQKVGIGLLKRHMTYDDQLIKQEQDWQQTCDRLIEENSKIKTESTHLLINMCRGKI